MQNQVNRYSQEELEEFRLLIVKKMDAAKEQLESLESQITEITESDDEHGTDMMDDSNTSSQLDLLDSMAIRQRQHIRDLENALIRVRNKSYGICVITGELIDKRRLVAVLTTTKSLAGKTIEATPPEKKEAPVARKTTAPKSFTKIIKKPAAPSPDDAKRIKDDFFDDDDDDDDDNDEGDFIENADYIDPDDIADDDND